MRQVKKLNRRYGDEVLDPVDSPEGRLMFHVIEDLRAERTTVEDATAEIERCGEIIARNIRATDDPGMITALDAENEARAKSEEPWGAAELLVSDAARDAALGIAKEDWILDVLKGHGEDEESQLGCLKIIVTLWQEGPWVWPRE
ncbi:MAG: hypothetical protein WAK24_17845 [Candidatus Acidiferrales bacterium]